MAATPPAPFTLTLLGGIELRGPEGAVESLLVRSKVIGLLAYLAIPTLGRFVRRDTLVGILWPELDQSRARTALRKAVFEVRAALGNDAVLARGDEDLALSATLVWCDAAAFTSNAESGRLMRALELYQGPLMPGFHLVDCSEFDRWLETERANARERAAAVSWALAQQFEQDDQLTDATGMARRAIQFSWNDERALRRALLMLDRLGDRAGALRLYEEFTRRLKAEFEVEASAETVELGTRIRSGRVR